MKQMGVEWLDCGIQLDYDIHSFTDFTLIKQSSGSFLSIYSALLQSISLSSQFEILFKQLWFCHSSASNPSKPSEWTAWRPDPCKTMGWKGKESHSPTLGCKESRAGYWITGKGKESGQRMGQKCCKGREKWKVVVKNGSKQKAPLSWISKT